MQTSKSSPRKLSWQYDDLTKKIQIKRQPEGKVSLAAKLVLRHLGSSADDQGRSHHGYRSIAAHCCITERGVSKALAILKQMGIVSWSGQCGKLNHYQLNLDAMRTTVRKQGIFGEDGKLLPTPEHRTGVTPEHRAGVTPEQCSVLPRNGETNKKAGPRNTVPYTPEQGSYKPSCNPHEKNQPPSEPFGEARGSGDFVLKNPVPETPEPKPPIGAVAKIWDGPNDDELIGWRLANGNLVGLDGRAL
jgi:hypothetical protein